MWEPLGVFGVAVIGGLMPLWGKGGDRFLHGCLALSTGIFLAAVFLHLLPELSGVPHGEAAPPPTLESESAGASAGVPLGAEASEPAAPGGSGRGADGAPSHQHHGDGDPVLWSFVLIGVLGVYLAETLFFGRGEIDDVGHHRNVGYATLFGLSLHALSAGLAFSAAGGTTVFVAIMAHKGFETFSLGSVFRLAKFSRTRLLILLGLFSLVTPLGMLVGAQVLPALGARGQGIATAVAAGTFLYVCLCELLPEVFHRAQDMLLKLMLLFLGIGGMAAIQSFEH